MALALAFCVKENDMAVMLSKKHIGSPLKYEEER
jgi:hypothetical protein